MAEQDLGDQTPAPLRPGYRLRPESIPTIGREEYEGRWPAPEGPAPVSFGVRLYPPRGQHTEVLLFAGTAPWRRANVGRLVLRTNEAHALQRMVDEHEERYFAALEKDPD